MRSTYITAAVIGLLIALWLLSGQVDTPDVETPAPLSEQNRRNALAAEDKPPTRVRARVIQASDHTEQLVLRGRTENKRTVQVRTEIGGRVISRPVERGDQVKAGTLLCRISLDDREVSLNEAQQSLNQAEIEYQGSLKLKEKGFQSDTAIATSKARLASAQAELARRRMDVERLAVRAPFAGMVEDTHLEVGDFSTPGTPCATIVDLNPMMLRAAVSERDVSRLTVGQTASGVLIDGTTVQGEVTFVGRQSDPQTRTYPVEVQVDNADFAIRSGVTTEVRLPVEVVKAQRISPALLSLRDDGLIGVRLLNSNNQVEFHLVEMLEDSAEGVWVTGLPERATLITVGQELVVPGEQVEVEFEVAPEMPAQAPSDPPLRNAEAEVKLPSPSVQTAAIAQ